MASRLTVLLVLATLPAFAQDADGRYRLYINPSTLITASRLVGLIGRQPAVLDDAALAETIEWYRRVAA